MSHPQPGQRSSLLVQGRLKLSELFPLMSRRRAPLSSAFFGPIILVLLLVVLLASEPDAYAAIAVALLAALSLMGLAFLNVLCGLPRPWWWSAAGYGLAFGVIALELSLNRPIILWFASQGNVVLDENLPRYVAGLGFLGRFRVWLFGAGLPEELLKATPVAAAALLGRFLPAPWRQRLGVLNPLDGVLLGAAAGAGFILREGYIYGLVLPANLGEAFRQILLRTFGFVGMHSAWSGIFGYYIGLAVVNRRRWVQLVLAGWILSASVHATWNAANNSGPVTLFLVGVASYALFASSILKAQQSVMSAPARPAPAPRLEPVAAKPVPEQPGDARRQAPHDPSPAPALVADSAATAAAAPLGRSVRLRAGSQVLELRPGDTVQAHQLPGFDHADAAETVGEVVANPTDPSIWGLRNRSTVVWHAVVRPGDERQIQPGHSVRLASGVTLRLGAITIEVE